MSFITSGALAPQTGFFGQDASRATDLAEFAKSFLPGHAPATPQIHAFGAASGASEKSASDTVASRQAGYQDPLRYMPHHHAQSLSRNLTIAPESWPRPMPQPYPHPQPEPQVREINYGTGFLSGLAKIPVFGELAKGVSNSIVTGSEGLGSFIQGLGSFAKHIPVVGDFASGLSGVAGGVFEGVGGAAFSLLGIPQVDGPAIDTGPHVGHFPYPQPQHPWHPHDHGGGHPWRPAPWHGHHIGNGQGYDHGYSDGSHSHHPIWCGPVHNHPRPVPPVHGIPPYFSFEPRRMETDDGLLVAGDKARLGFGGGLSAAAAAGAALAGGAAIAGGAAAVAATASPVALDLNGDGKISTTGVSTAKDRVDNQVGETIAFDLDGDGRKEQVEWIKGGDGFLVDPSMIGRNGEIDGRALMGDQGGRFTDGYAKMALYDSNRDGQLTGPELDRLAVWIDRDGDGSVDAGELTSTDAAGVHQMSTMRHDVTNGRGETLMQSTANNGGILTEDIWLGVRR